MTKCFLFAKETADICLLLFIYENIFDDRNFSEVNISKFCGSSVILENQMSYRRNFLTMFRHLNSNSENLEILNGVHHKCLPSFCVCICMLQGNGPVKALPRQRIHT
jgi:hypothetical protein